MKIKLFKQSKGYCGPACFKMVLSAYGINLSEDYLAKLTKTSRIRGCSEKMIIKVAKKLGFKGYIKNNSSINELKKLTKKDILPIVAWTSPEEGGHFSVVSGFNKNNILLADPHFGKIKKHKTSWFKNLWKEDHPKTNKEIIVVYK